MATKTSGNAIEDNSELMDRFSRQIGAFGTTMMARLVEMKVLIVGCSGVGVEVAKNLILLGPKQVTLFDPELVRMADLGANFCLETEDVGKKTRADASVTELSDLNSGCNVGTLTGKDGKAATELSKDLIGSFDVLVMTNSSRKDIQKWNKFCHNRTRKVAEKCGGSRTVPAPIGFVAVHTRGAAGSMFTDFGEDFEIFDANGEAVVERLVSNITCEKEGIIEVLPPQPRQKLQHITQEEVTGWVQLSEVEGCFAKDKEALRDLGYLTINDAPAWRVTNMKRQIYRNGKKTMAFDPTRYKIGDTSQLSKYQSGGLLKQVKMPYKVDFKTFEDAVRNPGDHAMTDMTKFDWSTSKGAWHHLHIAFIAVMEFEESTGSLPKPNDDEDTATVVKMAAAYNDAMKVVKATVGDSAGWCVEKLDVDLVAKYARHAACELQPLCTFFGGVVAQEVAKWTGKFTPNQGFLHLDFMEILPNTRPEDTAATGSRYDHQIAMFGQKFQAQLGDVQTFMVGCGALGCELLKNFAMMGVACHDGKGKGLITVTDDDKIEVSNLSRQFLFRPENVQQYKAEAATKRILSYNPQIKVDTKKVKVMKETEDVFNGKFWDKQDFITNALDNIHARLYVDSKCVDHAKPLLESGTLGTKCNTVIVVPFKTKSYADDNAAGGDEAQIPMCTLRNFPSLLDHCVEWSRSRFTDLFVEPMKLSAGFAEDPEGFLKKLKDHKALPGASERAMAMSKDLDLMKTVKSMVEVQEANSFAACVKFAWNLFHEHFRDKIVTLITQFPPGATTEEGKPFWTAKKKVPHPLSATFEDPVFGRYALQFITSVANVMAASTGLVACPQASEGLLPKDHEYRSAAKIKSICATLTPPEVKIGTVEDAHEEEEAAAAAAKSSSDDAAAAMETDGDEDQKAFEELLAFFEARAKSIVGSKFAPAKFEKDQDMNFHIDFIESFSNLRAINYNIKPGSRHKTKMIAGKILPAILTATASITGLIMLELYKLVQKKPLLAVRNAFCNLGVNLYLFENPDPIPVTKKHVAYEGAEPVMAWPEKGFTKWDKVVVDEGDLTVEEFCAHIKKMTGLTVTNLSHPCAVESKKDAQGHGVIAWMKNHWNPKKQSIQTKRSKMKITDLFKEIYGTNGIAEDDIMVPSMDVELEDDEEEERIMPRIEYVFKK